MNITAAAYSNAVIPSTSRAASAGATEAPQESVPVDVRGGAAAGAIGLVMAGGAHAFASMGRPGLVMGMDAFIGGSIGAQMAESLGKSKLAGAAVGAGVGLAMAAAGIYGGWPGALGAAALAAVARGVVLPRMLA